MKHPLKLLAVLAHPDDETLGTGSTLAKYASEGVDTYLICATRGERGWAGDEKDNPGFAELGKIREGELKCAAEILGIKQVYFLDFMDGELDGANVREAIEKIASLIRHIQPQVTLSFGPDGAYGHPDHIAISQFARGACLLAADSTYQDRNRLAPHRVSKFYYYVNTKELVEAYTAIFGNIQMEVDGKARSFIHYEDWAYTTVIDGSFHWNTVLAAVNCHKSQVAVYGGLNSLSEEKSVELWGKRTYYRAFSSVNGGRKRETDFFEGIR
jgi:LmbE family N-acetylglucosaminyl deacetylase